MLPEASLGAVIVLATVQFLIFFGPVKPTAVPFCIKAHVCVWQEVVASPHSSYPKSWAGASLAGACPALPAPSPEKVPGLSCSGPTLQGAGLAAWFDSRTSCVET